MPNRERKRVPDHRSDVLKGFLSRGPLAHPRKHEISEAKKRMRKRGEMKQLRETWKRMRDILYLIRLLIGRKWRS